MKRTIINRICAGVTSVFMMAATVMQELPLQAGANENVSDVQITEPIDYSKIRFGDVNLDGCINASDAAMIDKWLEDPEANPLSPLQLINADVYNQGDGVNASDSWAIIRYYTGELSKLPYNPTADDPYETTPLTTSVSTTTSTSTSTSASTTTTTSAMTTYASTSTTTSTETFTTVSTDEIDKTSYKLGDVNLDGKINTLDSSIIIYWLNDPVNNPLTPTQLYLADVYNQGDGVTEEDAQTILDYYNHHIYSLPYNTFTTTPVETTTQTTTTTAATTQTTTETTATTESTTEPLLRAPDRLTYDENGTARYYEDGNYLTGVIAAKPNYLLGDINGDGSINASDAANILIAAAKSGAESIDAGVALTERIDKCRSKEQAYAFADIDNNAQINASDAAQVLIYAAKAGVDATTPPLGTCYYYGSTYGILQKGLIVERITNNTYYAGEDYRLVTGWVTIDGEEYCFGTDFLRLKNAWADQGEERYYLNTSGKKATGWVTIDGTKYYFDENSHPLPGLQEIDGSNYYFDENGAICTGQIFVTLYDHIETYYFDETTGKGHSGWVYQNGSPTAYCENGRLMLNEWLTIGEPASYATAGKVANTSGVTCEVYSVNHYANGRRYYFDGIHPVKGYKTIDGNLYYFDEYSGLMQTSTIHDDYLIGADGICREIPKGGSGNKTKDATAVANVIVQCIAKDCTDLEKVTQAANYVELFSQTRCTYTMSGSDYATAYGVFVKGEYSCAGSTRALGLVLTQLGYKWTHVNENQYSHQWCRLTMDGQVGFADGQVGNVGYGKYSIVE